jgi:hypothetical protein
MAKPIIARSGQETKSRAERIVRAQRLFEEHAGEFVYRDGIWHVPSAATNGTTTYEVTLQPERCECPAFEHAPKDGTPRCKHIIAASIAHAKSGVCSCCGQRVLGRFITEVNEDDGLLSWFPGDVLCADCIRAGFWC